MMQTHIYTNVRTHIYTNVRTYIYTNVRTHINKCTYTYIQMYAHRQINTYMHLHVRTLTHIDTHTGVYTHICTLTHKHTRITKTTAETATKVPIFYLLPYRRELQSTPWWLHPFCAIIRNYFPEGPRRRRWERSLRDNVITGRWCLRLTDAIVYWVGTAARGEDWVRRANRGPVYWLHARPSLFIALGRLGRVINVDWIKRLEND